MLFRRRNRPKCKRRLRCRGASRRLPFRDFRDTGAEFENNHLGRLLSLWCRIQRPLNRLLGYRFAGNGFGKLDAVFRIYDIFDLLSARLAFGLYTIGALEVRNFPTLS